jgi:hypothetical protein
VQGSFLGYFRSAPMTGVGVSLGHLTPSVVAWLPPHRQGQWYLLHCIIINVRSKQISIQIYMNALCF